MGSTEERARETTDEENEVQSPLKEFSRGGSHSGSVCLTALQVFEGPDRGLLRGNEDTLCMPSSVHMRKWKPMYASHAILKLT